MKRHHLLNFLNISEIIYIPIDQMTESKLVWL